MQIENLFSVLELIEEQKIPLVAFMFIGEAEHLWHLKKETLLTPTTWDQIFDVLLKSLFLVYVWK